MEKALQTTVKMLSPTLTRALYYVGVFSSWTFTSYLCHLFAKKFLTLFTTSFEINFWTSLAGAVMITLIQILMCFVSIKLSDEKGQNHKLTNASLHALATFLTNLSLTVMFASSTLAIKLMEPITSALTQYHVMGTPLKSTAAVSLPLIVLGAIAFTGNPLSEVSLTLGVGAALASNIVFAFRNLSLKKLNASDQSGIRFRTIDFCTVWFPIAIVACCGLAVCLERLGVIPRSLLEAATYGFLSAIFHVTYSFVSVGLVLKEMSVVSHAVLNISKRLLVVVLLYMSSVRVANSTNFIGLGVCTIGLFLYSADRQIFNFCSERMVKLISIVVLIAFVASSTRVANNDIYKIISGYSSPALIPRHTASQPANNLHILTLGFNQPTDLDLLPDLSRYTVQERREIEEFLGENLAKNSTRSNFLSQKLPTTVEVIKETQRIHYNIFRDVLGSYKYGMLLDTADFENKGDPAITAAEIYFLARIKLDLIYYCNTVACTKTNLAKAAEVARKYSPKDLVILLHGGGNINGYEEHDILRFQIFDLFKGFRFFMFPQSIWLKPNSMEHQELCRKMYCCHENLTIVLRDTLSYSIAENFFKGATRLLMAPDIVFHLGPVTRSMAPVFDILWIRRIDKEGPKYSKELSHPPHLRLHVSDWYQFHTPKAGTSLEKSMYATMMGLFYIQRARVIITDRLHGHILSMLLDIPHVLVDNPAKKLSSYHNTWTRGVEIVRLTDDPTKAVGLAVELLEVYKNELPPRSPWLNISEMFQFINYTLPESDFS